MASGRDESLWRSFVTLHVIALLIGLLLVLPTFAPANAAGMLNLRSYAGIVVDAKTGKVLYESDADAKRYPASVTKVMTLYVLFQELKAGNLSLSSKLTVSAFAAKAVPTKLGIAKGSTITVENAIKALVTISANDIARVIAENISGSESKFAERMTATARALGMKNTTYRNASGLPDPGQVTTVRDQAILGIAIYQHFPKYYEYFQTKSFKFGKRTYGNHNNLLGKDGVDGIKTGYINASGFNLLTASRTDNKHIVVVGFGFGSAGARDAQVRDLVRKYLPKAREGGYLDVAMIPLPGRQGGGQVMVASSAPVFVTPMPYPSFRMVEAVIDPATVATATVGAESVLDVAAVAPQPMPMPQDLGQQQAAVDAATQLGAPTSSAPQPYDRSSDVIGAFISDTYVLGAPPADLGQTAPSAPLLPPVGVGDEGEALDLVSTQSAVTGPAAAGAGDWVVQIGAAANEDGARGLLLDATSKLTSLADFRSYVEQFEKNGKTFYRARFSGFVGRDDAAAICGQLKKIQMSCLAVQS